MELRDKLFTEEQYIKQLAKYYCRIEKLNSMIEQSEKEGDEISPDLYGRLFDCRVYTIVTMYSMGENLEFIKSDAIFRCYKLNCSCSLTFSFISLHIYSCRQ